MCLLPNEAISNPISLLYQTSNVELLPRFPMFIPYYGLILCDIQVCDLRIEINQASEDQSVWHQMATHYDITMGNDVARGAHCKITIGNDIARYIHCDITMSNDVAMSSQVKTKFYFFLSRVQYKSLYKQLCLGNIIIVELYEEKGCQKKHCLSSWPPWGYLL